MDVLKQRAVGSFLALVSLGYMVLATMDSWSSPGLIVGGVVGLGVGIGGCMTLQARHRHIAAWDRSRPLGWFGWVALVGSLLILQLLWLLARALGVAYDVGVFVVSVFGVGGTIFFLWLGWWFAPATDQPPPNQGWYDWQRPPISGGESDKQSWRTQRRDEE